jgi:hypothetical protein
MIPSEQAVTHHRVPVHTHKAAGLPHAAAFAKVRQDRDNLLVGQLRPKERRAFAFRKTLLTGPAIQDPPLLVPAIVVADTQVAVPAFTVVRTLLVLATKLGQLVHGRPPWHHRILKSPAQFLQNLCLGEQYQ